MKITKEQLRKIIMEEVANEEIITGPDGDASVEGRGIARLEDVIEYLLQQDRNDLAEPLRQIQQLLM